MAIDRVLEMSLVARDKASAVFNKVESRAKKLGAAVKAAFKPIAIAVGIATTAIAGGALIMIKAAAAAEVQRLAINKLELGLRNIGKFTPEVSREMQDFASSLQQVTVVGDEMILSGMAQLAMLGQLSDEGLKRATVATLDLSAAIGIDFNTASLLMAKAAAGNVSSLSRYGLTLEATGDKQKDFEALLKLIEERMGGSASIATDSFTGKMTQLKNTLGDAFEQLGKGVNESDRLQKKIQELSRWIEENSDRIEDFGEKIAEFAVKAIDFLVDKILNFRRVLADFLLTLAEILNQMAALIETSVRMQALFGASGDAVRDLSAAASGAALQLILMQDAIDAEREAAEKQTKATEEQRDEMLKLSGFVDATTESFQDLAAETEKLPEKTVEATEETVAALEEFIPEIIDMGDDLGTNLGESFLDAYTEVIPEMITETEQVVGKVQSSLDGLTVKVEATKSQIIAGITKTFGLVIGAGAARTPEEFAAATRAAVGFADGGIVRKPTFAMVGEAGPEAIIPLNKAGGIGKTIINNVTLNFPGAIVTSPTEMRKAARELIPFINEENAR